MITLFCGDQIKECTDDEAIRILNIQKVMKATHWQIKEDVNTRTDKGISTIKATQKRIKSGGRSSK
jgi:hypothetical protein